MSFDEFLSRRLPELLRTAFLLCGDRERAADLVVSVLAAAFPQWTHIAGAGRPFGAVRAAIARAYLTVSAGAGTPVAAGDPLAGLDPEQRVVRVLGVYSGQSPVEIADALDVHAVPSDAAEAAGGSGSDDAAGLAALESWADTLPEDGPALVAARVLDLIEAAAIDADPAFAGLFAAYARQGRGPTPVEADPASAAIADVDPAPSVDAPIPSVAPAEPLYRPLGDGAAVRWVMPDPVDPPEADLDDDEDDADPGRAVRSRRVRILSGVGATAVVLMVAVAITALVSHRAHTSTADGGGGPQTSLSDRPSAPPSAGPSTGPVSTQVPMLPGTKVLQDFYGSGSRVIKGADYPLAAGRQLAVDVACSGPGHARVGPILVRTCNGQSAGFAITTAQLRSAITITTDPSTTWRFMLVDEPVHGTNGSLEYPAGAQLTSSSPLQTTARASGTGTQTVPLASGTVGSRVQDLRLILTCRGAGVSLASEDGRFDGLYTHTCFAGWSYDFEVTSALLPGMLTVTASPSTSWQLVVVHT